MQKQYINMNTSIIIINIIISLFLIIYSYSILAADIDIKTLANKQNTQIQPLQLMPQNDIFTNVLKNFTNIKGDFVQVQTSSQVKSLPNKNAYKILQGNFMLAKPAKFIWQYTAPFEQTIQSDSKKLYIYDKDLNQVTIKKTEEVINSSPIAIFFISNSNNLSTWNKYFNYEIYNPDINIVTGIFANKIDKKELNKIQTWIVLKPKNSDSIYKNLNIGLELTKSNTDNNEILMPKILTFKDNLGNEGYIILNNIQKRIFKADEFNFIIPKSAEVIEN